MSPKSIQTKSRNGCLLCKSKRIKCDEAKPACRRCEQKGFRCPGYVRNLKWVNKSQSQPLLNQIVMDPDFSKSSIQIEPVPDDVPVQSPPATEDWSFSILDSSHPQDLPQFDSSIPAIDDSSLADTTWDDIFQDWNDEIVSSPTYLNDLPIETNDITEISNEISILDPNIFMTEEIDNELSKSVVMTKQVLNVPSALCDYFFKEVITLFCVWDSNLNYMRVIIQNLWQSSSVLYHTMQSMAAACLAGEFPDLSSIAVKEHFQALQCLHDSSNPPASKEESLFSLWLLGHTASWHSPHDLAIERYKAAQSMLNELHGEGKRTSNIIFLEGTLDYWSMLLAYLTDTADINSPGRVPFAGPATREESILPHPYYGTSRGAIRILTDVGVLIFQYRKHMSRLRFMTDNDLTLFRTRLTQARRLERLLLAYTPFDLPQILDPGDPNTPIDHFRKMDEAYRCTGLLQLYRVFPDLLSERYNTWDPSELLNPRPSLKRPTPDERDLWLTKFALHTLDILRAIPFESNTRCIQPFILVSVASELRLHKSSSQQQRQRSSSSSSPSSTTPSFFTLDATALEVSRARKFVSARLSAYMHVLPLPKIRKIYDLVTALWARLDAGDGDVYWLDMAYQKQMGTLMG